MIYFSKKKKKKKKKKNKKIKIKKCNIFIIYKEIMGKLTSYFY